MQEPRLVTLTATRVVGLHAKFLHGLSPETNAGSVIGKLWHEFSSLEGDVPNRVEGGPCFGVIWGEPDESRSHPDELHYLACVEVTSFDDVPEGMISRAIPESVFAAVTHRGSMDRIAETIRPLYRDWLPGSEWEHAGVADIEIYDERFSPVGGESEMEYLISVRPRTTAE